MTEDILQLMDRKRKSKIQGNLDKYNRLNREVNRACNERKEKFLNDQCAEIENLYHLAPKEAHQKIREVTGKFRSNSPKYSSIKASKHQVSAFIIVYLATHLYYLFLYFHYCI